MNALNPKGIALALSLISADSLAQSCGDVITSSMTLTRDLTDCPATGLVVAGDNLKIKLNGHTLDGTGVEAGISVMPGSAKIQILGPGRIQDFGTGVAVNDSFQVLLKSADLADNGSGVYFREVVMSRVEDTVISGGLDGIVLDGPEAMGCGTADFRLLLPDGSSRDFPRTTKVELAREIVAFLAA